jgi:hypothetical protein
MRRPDIGVQLPALETYGSAWKLPPDRFAAIRDRIDQCNARAHDQEQRPTDRSREQLPRSAAPSAPHPAPGARAPRAPGFGTPAAEVPRATPQLNLRSQTERVRATALTSTKENRGLDR